MREALSRAGRHHSIADVARATGVHRNLLYTFLSRGTLGPDKLAQVERWLIAREYVPTIELTEREVIAAEIEVTAAVLRSSSYTDSEALAAINRLYSVLAKKREK